MTTKIGRIRMCRKYEQIFIKVIKKKPFKIDQFYAVLFLKLIFFLLICIHTYADYLHSERNFSV